MHCPRVTVPPSAPLDADRLQVVWNVLANAVKFRRPAAACGPASSARRPTTSEMTPSVMAFTVELSPRLEHELSASLIEWESA